MTVPYQGIDYTLSTAKSQYTSGKEVSVSPEPVKVEVAQPGYLDILKGYFN